MNKLAKELPEPRPLIDRFLDMIWAERGLSENTLKSYRHHLTTLWRSLLDTKTPIELATRSDLLNFIAKRVEAGVSPRSTRHILSSFRRFYRWLVRMGVRDTDPTEDIEMPKVGRPLPKTLTEAEVKALLRAPDTTSAIGHRDRTALEMLYASGLRASELINLRLSQVNFNQGAIRIIGKALGKGLCHFTMVRSAGYGSLSPARDARSVKFRATTSLRCGGASQ